MVQGKLKVLKGGVVAVYVKRKDAVREDAPWDKWRPGFGVVQPEDRVIESGDDAGLVCSNYCYDAIAIERSRMAKDLKDLTEGSVIDVQVSKGSVSIAEKAGA